MSMIHYVLATRKVDNHSEFIAGSIDLGHSLASAQNMVRFLEKRFGKAKYDNHLSWDHDLFKVEVLYGEGKDTIDMPCFQKETWHKRSVEKSPLSR